MCVCVNEFVFIDHKEIEHNHPKFLSCTDTVATLKVCELGHYLLCYW